MYKHQHFEDLLSLEVQVVNEVFAVEVHHVQQSTQRTIEKSTLWAYNMYAFNQKLMLSTFSAFN